MYQNFEIEIKKKCQAWSKSEFYLRSLFIKATLIIIINNEHVLLGTGGTGGGEPRARGKIEK